MAVQYSGAFCPASSAGLPATALGAPSDGRPVSLETCRPLLTCCPVGVVAGGNLAAAPAAREAGADAGLSSDAGWMGDGGIANLGAGGLWADPGGLGGGGGGGLGGGLLAGEGLWADPGGLSGGGGGGLGGGLLAGEGFCADPGGFGGGGGGAAPRLPGADPDKGCWAAGETAMGAACCCEGSSAGASLPSSVCRINSLVSVASCSCS